MNKKFIISTFLLFFIILLLSAIFILFIKPSLNSECGGNRVVGGNTTIGGTFELIDANNKILNSSELITEPSLIYFGYSYCPDVCPFDLQRNAITVDILSRENKEITPVFITIDPERDTTDRLKEFSSFIHPKLIALTGSDLEIKRVMKLFKVYGQKSNDEDFDEDTYLMDHSAFTYLVNSSNEFVDYFSRKVTAEEMADRISCYFEQIN
jgi:protein SCO1/2